ncbi:phosphopantetheine-binding protein [Schaalia sp. Marseille-Q2122]|uniref:phosphopantetheine-binding protein n=1 Tax=Schaalia sp. Marseille-Q2122 TaxID=2736604 RepID=UPI001589854D|nr:phosphopantetheine-binding protein [Schaalia sp. Marseille-Q2122]
MGTIGDLLGIDLAAAFAQDTSDAADSVETQDEALVASPSLGEEPDAQQESAHGADSTDGDSVNPRHEAVLAAIVAETALDPSRARLDLTLREDLDLDDLGLYAVVAAVEHELRCTFTDEAVRSWQTLGDILDAVDETKKSSRA